MSNLDLIVGIIIGIIVTALVMKLFFLGKEKEMRQKSVRQSRSSILGEVSEKMLPILPDFPYHTKDLVFLGKGVDYLVFDGLSRGELREIIFLEIKSGQSQLNRNERMIKDALGSKKVRYELMRIEY